MNGKSMKVNAEKQSFWSVVDENGMAMAFLFSSQMGMLFVIKLSLNESSEVISCLINRLIYSNV